MKEYIKMLMFAGMIIMGNAGAMDAGVAGAGAAGAEAPLSATELSLLNEIVTQSGLSSGKMKNKAVTKGNVIDAIRRTINNQKKTKRLTVKILMDLQEKFGANPRGTVYQYKEETDLDKGKLQVAKGTDIASVYRQQREDIKKRDMSTVDKVAKNIHSYMAQAKSDSGHAKRTALEDLSRFFNGCPAGAKEWEIKEALVDAGLLQLNAAGEVVAVEDFGVTADDIVETIVDACATHSRKFKEATAEAIKELRKQPLAEWYNSEIFPKVFPELIDTLSGEEVFGFDGQELI